jgi:hypothetical protein
MVAIVGASSYLSHLSGVGWQWRYVSSESRLGGEDGEPDCKPQYDRRGESGGEESEQESNWMGALRRRDGPWCGTLRKLQHEPLCGGKVNDEWISFVLDVEFEAFG